MNPLIEVISRNIENITSSTGYFLAVVGGAVSTELIRYIDAKRRIRMDFLKVLVASFVGTVSILAIHPYLIQYNLPEGVIRLIAVVFGCMGYKMARMWDSPEGVWGFLERWIKIIWLAKDLHDNKKKEDNPK